MACYAGGVALHAAGALVSWRALAYLAMFHFITGSNMFFLRLHARHEAPGAGRWLSTALIYTATLYSLLYWYLSPPRNFNWFVDGDFVQHDWPLGRQPATGLYLGLLLAYLGHEAWQYRRECAAQPAAGRHGAGLVHGHRGI